MRRKTTQRQRPRQRVMSPINCRIIVTERPPPPEKKTEHSSNGQQQQRALQPDVCMKSHKLRQFYCRTRHNNFVCRVQTDPVFASRFKGPSFAQRNSEQLRLFFRVPGDTSMFLYASGSGGGGVAVRSCNGENYVNTDCSETQALVAHAFGTEITR